MTNTVAPTWGVCNAKGGACLDYRIDGHFIGPCREEREFSDSVNHMPKNDHRIFFTHGDINLGNILVQDGRISGIVDWETAGWYPEYWEYTKCHWNVKWGFPTWITLIEKGFEDEDYSEELRIERPLWDSIL